MKEQSLGRSGLVAAAITILLWSSAFTGIRVGLEGYGPLQLTLLRFLVASASFGVYAVFTKMRLPERRDLPMLMVLALSGITIYHTALNLGEVAVPAATASFIITTAPAFTALLSALVLHEALGVRGWTGIVVSAAGSVVMALGGEGGVDFTFGALLILLAAACASVYFVYQKPLLSRYKPVELSAYVTWLGTVPLLAFSGGLLGHIGAAPLGSTLAAVYIGVFPGAVAYALWATTLKALPASRAATFLYISPVLAVGWGWLLMRELPTLMQATGGVIALLGVIVVNTRSQSRARSEGHAGAVAQPARVE